mgnify:CR=1 FL=1
MMKAIIIDDEKLIREGLVTYIDWASLDIEVCAVCADSTQGVQAAIEHRPQIILADICLPDCSGLDMFRQIRSYGLNCQIIFISSYSEFQYAQQAVKLGAFDYLLKPIEADTLYDCVKRCAEKVSTEKIQNPAFCDRNLLEKLLSDGLANIPQADQTFFHLVWKAGVPQNADVFLLVSTNKEDLYQKFRFIRTSSELYSYSASLSAHIHVICIFAQPGLNRFDLKQALSSRESADFSWIQISLDETDSILYISLQQALARLILRTKPTGMKEMYFAADTLEFEPQVIQNPEPKYIEHALYQFFDFCIHKQWTNRLLDFQFECFNFLENIYNQLSQYYGLPLPSTIDMHSFIGQLREQKNIYDLFFTLKSILSSLFGEVRRSCSHSPYTRKALSIIRSRYKESLSLKFVAKELHVSPSYLSSVFKEDMGCPFSDYLFSYRMNIALTLVKQGNCKIYEIGEMVGYPDIAQFSKCFKKQFGYSPKQMQNRGGE